MSFLDDECYFGSHPSEKNQREKQVEEVFRVPLYKITLQFQDYLTYFDQLIKNFYLCDEIKHSLSNDITPGLNRFIEDQFLKNIDQLFKKQTEVLKEVERSMAESLEKISKRMDKDFQPPSFEESFEKLIEKDVRNLAMKAKERREPFLELCMADYSKELYESVIAELEKNAVKAPEPVYVELGSRN